MEDFESADNWTASLQAGTPTVNTTTFMHGSAALNLIKTGTAGTTARITKTLPATMNVTGKTIITYVYIRDSTQLAASGTCVQLAWIGGAATISTNWDQSYITSGKWHDWGSVMGTANAQYTNIISQIRLTVTTAASNTTLSAGDVIFDFMVIDEPGLDRGKVSRPIARKFM